MSKSRLIWLDASKGLGLIFVILGHNLGIIEKTPFWHGYIYSFHMPLFFFLSGCTLNFSSAQDSIRRAAVHAYSYLLLAVAIMPVAMILTHNYNPLRTMGGILYATGHTIDVSPLWFLSCLSITLIYAAIFIAIAKTFNTTPNEKRYGLIGGIFLIFLGYCTLQAIGEQCVGKTGWGSIHESGVAWNADIAVTAVGYLLLGGYFSESCQRLSTKPQRQLALIFIASSSLLYFAYAEGMAHYDLNFRHIGPTIFSAYIPLLGIIACTSLGCILSNTKYLGKALSQLGQSGLIVLWLHSGIQNKAIKMIFDQMHIENDLGLWAISFCAAVSIPVLVDTVIIKRSPTLTKVIYPRFKFKIFEPRQNLT